MIIIISIKNKPIYKIQRNGFKQSDADKIIEQLRFASYKDGNFECKNQLTTDLIYSLFVAKIF